MDLSDTDTNGAAGVLCRVRGKEPDERAGMSEYGYYETHRDHAIREIERWLEVYAAVMAVRS